MGSTGSLRPSRKDLTECRFHFVEDRDHLWRLDDFQRQRKRVRRRQSGRDALRLRILLALRRQPLFENVDGAALEREIERIRAVRGDVDEVAGKHLVFHSLRVSRRSGSARHVPERSGLPSRARGAFADRFGLPSGVRGVPRPAEFGHCADADAVRSTSIARIAVRNERIHCLPEFIRPRL